MKIKSGLVAAISMILLTVAFSACDNAQKGGNGGVADTTVTNRQVDSSHVADIDVKALALKMGDYDGKIELLNKDFLELKDSVSDLSVRLTASEESSNPWNIAVMVALALSIIAVVFILWMQKNATDDKKLEDRILGSRKLSDLRKKVEELENSMWNSPQKGRRPSQSASDELSMVKRKIQDLESNLENLSKLVEAKQNSRTNSQPVVQGNGVRKEYYVGDVTDIYLINPTPSRQEKSVFRICETSPGKGEFEILNFAQVRQSNGLDKIIEYEPSGINIQNAELVKLVHRGNCVKEDAVWKVTRPIRIKIEKR